MLLMSWNVNGIRAIIKKGFVDFVERKKPDILCLQEIKSEEVDIGLPYHKFWHPAEKKGYAGTAIFTKEKPLKVENMFEEGRVILLSFKDFNLIDVYVPNSQRGLFRLDFRLLWDKKFRDLVFSKKPCIICGDLNVAHKEIDIARPKQNRRNAGFTDEERDSFDKLLAGGFIDSFRSLYPDKIAYSYFAPFANARAKNIGWRIDYFLVSEDLKARIKGAGMNDDVYGSDHIPVYLQLD